MRVAKLRAAVEEAMAGARGIIAGFGGERREAAPAAI
jgi:hypothetical protein